MNKRRLIPILLCLCICMAYSPHVQAEPVKNNSYGQNTDKELEPDYDDPDYIKMINKTNNIDTYSIDSNGNASPYTGMIYSHADKFKNKSIIYGIDVSKWQGKIDWTKVKAAGIQFAFIRCGYTALTNPFRMYEDEYFKKNIKEANAAGIKTGIYFFSNAKNETEVRKEASKTLEIINNYKDLITLPVVYDYEAFTKEYRAYGTPKTTVTKNAKIFMDIVKSNGYTPMYYGCPDVLDNLFNITELKDYQCWLANYTTKTNYTGDYSYWQYSESGWVDGISTPVDCDFYYDTGEYGYQNISMPDIGMVSGMKMASNSTSHISIKWNPLSSASGYEIYRSNVLGGDYKKVKTINGKNNTNYKDNTVKKSEGRQYYYKIIPFKNKDKIKQYGSPSKSLTAYTKKIHKLGLKTTANINLRTHAGTDYSPVITVPKETSLNISRYTFSSDNTKWYKVIYQKNQNKHTGYLCSDYVTTFTYGKTKAKTGVRANAGSKYKKYRNIPKNKRVMVLKTKKDKKGNKWNYITYTIKNKKYNGYVLASKISKV